MKQSLVLLLPIGGPETFAGGLFELSSDAGGLVDVVHFKFDNGNQVSQAEQLLRIRQADERPTGVIVEEARIENSYYVETIVFGDGAEGSQLALRTDHEYDGTNRGTEVVGHFLTQNDRRHGRDTLLDSGEGIGRWGRIRLCGFCLCGADTPVLCLRLR